MYQYVWEAVILQYCLLLLFTDGLLFPFSSRDVTPVILLSNIKRLSYWGDPPPIPALWWFVRPSLNVKCVSLFIWDTLYSHCVLQNISLNFLIFMAYVVENIIIEIQNINGSYNNIFIEIQNISGAVSGDFLSTQNCGELLGDFY